MKESSHVLVTWQERHTEANVPGVILSCFAINDLLLGSRTTILLLQVQDSHVLTHATKFCYPMINPGMIEVESSLPAFSKSSSAASTLAPTEPTAWRILYTALKTPPGVRFPETKLSLALAPDQTRPSGDYSREPRAVWILVKEALISIRAVSRSVANCPRGSLPWLWRLVSLGAESCSMWVVALLIAAAMPARSALADLMAASLSAAEEEGVMLSAVASGTGQCFER